ncbi:MAG: hypothetical protein J6Q05_06470, partial [Elusimicrobiaceae bacterium]|nr:hypothetical protein [Elusimicrobiaceae bacterium]
MNLFLKLVITVLIFFTPFSFAATEAWAFTVLQGLLLVVAFLLFFSRRVVVFPSLFKAVFATFAILIVFALVQSCFPQTLLETVPWHPFTLMRLYTLEHASVFVTYLGVGVVTAQVYQSWEDVKQLAWTLVICAACVELCELLFPQGQYIAFLTG